MGPAKSNGSGQTEYTCASKFFKGYMKTMKLSFHWNSLQSSDTDAEAQDNI